MTDSSQRPIVILLEDEQQPRELLHKALEQAGYSVFSSDVIAAFNQEPEADGSYGINTGFLTVLGLNAILTSSDNLPDGFIGRVRCDNDIARENGVSQNALMAITKNDASLNPNIAAIVSDHWLVYDSAESLFDALKIAYPDADIKAMSVSISSRNGLQEYVSKTAKKDGDFSSAWAQAVIACVNDIAQSRGMKPVSTATEAANSEGAGDGTPMRGLRNNGLDEKRSV